MAVVLAIDIGTSSLKGALVNDRGKLLAFARDPLPENPENGAFWYKSLRRILQLEVFRQAQSPDAVCIGGNAPTLVPVFGNGEEGSPAFWYGEYRTFRKPDQRSYYLPVAASLYHRYGKELEYVLGCPEYLAWRLTGVRSSFTAHDQFTPFVWDEAQIHSYGFRNSVFAPLVKTGDRVGVVSSKAAYETGLPEGIPCIAGAPDYHCSLLGSLTVVPGRVCDRAGTSEGLNLCVKKRDPVDGLRSTPHLLEGLYNWSVVLPYTGGIFEGYRKALGWLGRDYKEMICRAVRSGHVVESLCCRPMDLNLIPEKDLENFGVESFGQVKHVLMFNLLLAICFSVRSGLDQLESSGWMIDRFVVSGGQARTDEFNQLKADVTGRSVVVPEMVDTELFGLAAIGLYGSGTVPDLVKAAEGLFRVKAEFNPQMDASATYDRLFRIYQNKVAEKSISTSEL